MQTLVELGFSEDDHIGMTQCLKAYGWGPVPGVVVFEDALKALDRLTERGIKTGIVTNASQSMVLRDVELEHFNLLKYFPNVDTRISAADVGFLKPHETIFRRALEAVGSTPEETVFVGDNPVADIAGAQSIGMKAVLRILSPAPTLISGLIVPDAALNSLDELPMILDNWFEW
jgi:FMN phosphatase YigB (HAD superfamily)